MTLPGAEGYWSDVDQSPDAEVVHVSDEHDTFVGRDVETSLLGSEVGERGWLGNPFVLLAHGGQYSREQSLAKYAELLLDRFDQEPELRRALWQLRDDRLACFCRHEGEEEPACHADVLVSVINAQYRSRQKRREAQRTEVDS